MRVYQMRADGAGFGVRTEAGDDLPLREAGEIWAPRHWSIHWHTNDGWEVYLQVKGHSRWESEAGSFEVPEHGAYLVRGGVRHRLVELTQARTHFYYVVVPPEDVPATVRAAPCWQRAWSVFPRATTLQLPLQGIIRELAVKEPWQAEACQGYVASLGTALARLSVTPRAERSVDHHPAAVRARRLLSERPEHPWRLDTLARLAGVSVPHLIALYRAAYGETPMKSLRALRLAEARRQLEQTDKRVTDIALDLGFASSQHLARTFRAAFQQTPTAARAGVSRWVRAPDQEIP